MNVGDAVILNTPENPRLHGKPGVVAQVVYLVRTEAAATGEFRAVPEEVVAPEAVNGHDTPVAMKYLNAAEFGYTGSVCPTCQGGRMVRNGNCEKCEDCGTTSGCS